MKNGLVFENEIMRLEHIEGIMHGWYKAGTITLEMAKRIVKDRLEFTENQPVKMLVRQAGLRGIDREARNYLSSDEGIAGVLAGAIVTKSAFESHLANFFINITVVKLKIPTKVFTDAGEALEWLKKLE